MSAADRANVENSYMNSQSSWHFDNTRQAAIGKDSYTPVCIFDADFTDVINQCIDVAQPRSWGYGSWGEGGGISLVVIDIPIFNQMAHYLGLLDPVIRFHNQTTGQMLYLHVDDVKEPLDQKTGVASIELNRSPTIMRRFSIMLADWEMGQAWMFGNALYHQWVAGTCITWEWRDMPHATVNAGWQPRPLVQITGIQTARTMQLLQLAESNTSLILPKIEL